MAERECDGGVSADVSNTNHHSDSPCEIKLAGDCISSLPDEILQHIISQISTQAAIRTSVLSKRWKHVWSKLPSLSIDCYSMANARLLNETLISYSAPKIMIFDLRVRNDVTASQIDSLIKLAMSRNAENLSFIFNVIYSFSDFFFHNSSMKQLSVTLGFFDTIPKCIVSWTSLKSLSLSYCNLPGESIANILSGCSILESMTLKSCSGLHHLDLSESLRLTTLDIDRWGYVRRPMQIVAPHIHSLRFTNSLKLCNLVDVYSLTEANFSLEYYDYINFDFHQDMVLKMLAKLQNIEKLTIGIVLLQILSLAELRGLAFPQFKIKDLTVETMVIRSVIPGIVRLLQNSPELNKITVHTKKRKAIKDEELNVYLKWEGLNPDQCWNELFPTSSMYDGIVKDAKSEDVALFIELLMQNTKTLETMVLRLESYLKATEYQKLLPMVPTVSSRNTTNSNVRNCGQEKAILNSFKIIP